MPPTACLRVPTISTAATGWRAARRSWRHWRGGCAWWPGLPARWSPPEAPPLWSLSGVHGGLREHRVKGRAVFGGSQPLNGGGFAQQAGDACQCLQVIGAGVLGRQQQEDQVYRLTVQGLKLNRLVEAREHADNPRQRRKATVGYGNAAPDAS